MAKDVLITPLNGIIQFSSSAGAGTGQIKVDSDDLVISNLVGDVLLGDGASDVFIGNGSDNVDIVFEQNGEIRDDGTGKSITLGSKTTNVFITSSTVVMQKDSGNVGIGTVNANSVLHISGSSSTDKLFLIEDNVGADILIVTGSGTDVGRVGIGTSTPKNTLSVSGSLTVFTSNQTSRLTVGEADDSGVTTANSLVIETTGASNKSHTFTIGTGNDYVIEALGNKSDIHLSAKASTRFGINNGSAYNFTQQMVLTGSTGNLGIGTNTPPEKLTVQGNISASGFVSASSFSGDGAGLSNVSATVSGDTFATDLKIGRDADNLIDFTTDNQIQFRVNAGNELKLNNAHLFPAANDGHSLGAAGLAFSDLFLADAAVINFNNGEINLTQTDAKLVMSGSGATTLEVKGDINVDGNLSNVATTHITASGNISASGDLIVDDITADDISADTIGINTSLFHTGDTNTNITFGTDTITMKAGNEAFITITEDDSQDNIVIGDGGDIDFHVKAGGSNTLFAQGSSQNIGIGTATPTEKLEIVAGGRIKVTPGTDATGSILSLANDHDVLFSSQNDSAGGDPQQFVMQHNDGNTEIINRRGNLMLSASGDITLDAAGKDIKLSDSSGTAEFIFNLENTPELDVDGDFTIDGSGLIKLDSATSRIEAVGHITASGNISASGDNHTFGGTTTLGDIVNFGSMIRHTGDTNTRIVFATDKITLAAGGVDMITLTEATTDTIEFGAAISSHITASGNISASGIITAEGLVISDDALITDDLTVNGDIVGDGNTQIKNFGGVQDSGGENYIAFGSNLLVTIGDGGGSANSTALKVDDNNNKITMTGDAPQVAINTTTPAPNMELTVQGDISASGGLIGGRVGSQPSGSYDFPGAIMGYTNIGSNSGHASYTITTSYAVPDSEMNVIFVVPKSGKVEIMVQVQVKDNSFSADTVNCALSDSATYNTIGAQHEVSAFNQDETGTDIKTIRWSIEGLTAGATLQYWFAVQNNIGASGQSLQWGGSGTGRFPDFIMKVTALPSNSVFL